MRSIKGILAVIAGLFLALPVFARPVAQTVYPSILPDVKDWKCESYFTVVWGSKDGRAKWISREFCVSPDRKNNVYRMFGVYSDYPTSLSKDVRATVPPIMFPMELWFYNGKYYLFVNGEVSYRVGNTVYRGFWRNALFEYDPVSQALTSKGYLTVVGPGLPEAGSTLEVTPDLLGLLF